MRLGISQSTSSLRIIALATLLFAIAGCGNSSIVGKWRMSGSDATVWEFRTNGAVLVGDVSGRYKLGDQDRIKIETPFATTVYQLKISGDQMVLQEPGGSKLEFMRIKDTQR
jgi:DNA-binding transcriptional regulator of glucitol operon